MKVVRKTSGNTLTLSMEEWAKIGRANGWLSAEAKSVKQRSRGTCVFQNTDPKVKDNKDHFPINDLAHGRNALQRVEQYKSCPKWYDGTLKQVQDKVKREVYKKFPGLKSRKEKREKGATAKDEMVKIAEELTNR